MLDILKVQMTYSVSLWVCEVKDIYRNTQNRQNNLKLELMEINGDLLFSYWVQNR